MPELPEVETIRNLLRLGTQTQPGLLNQTITGVHLLWARSLAIPGETEFLNRLTGQKIQAIERRGKYLVFCLTDGYMLIHLRMSGDLQVEPSGADIAPHHRLLIDFEENFRLAFNDARKFGRVWLVDNPNIILDGLGPEPLDNNFTALDLHSRLINIRRQLKPLLLDQKFLAGLGNIYTDEALHSSALHPLKLSNTLSLNESQRLWQAIRTVLQDGIRRNGASIDWVYRGGEFQNYFLVYKRTGLPCFVCGTAIMKIIVGQRGTHYCPTCQSL